ncbi:uL15 family ribosomal protein [Candidatus Woesearchaeota archaeon]|nr:uL15 family ribosomal protein [Candidatus Woesearchaeota archaeon]
MQTKRKKRSRIRAAKVTAGHGSKKKNRGAGHRGGRGKSGAGKRGDFKIMKITKGMPKKEYLGKHGFKMPASDEKAINLNILQDRLASYLEKGLVSRSKDTYEVDLGMIGYQKLLSKGAVRVKLSIKVARATQNAIDKVEAAGGKIVLLEDTAAESENLVDEESEDASIE